MANPCGVSEMYRKFVTIYCDGDNGVRCLQFLETGIATVENARKHAVHEHGWQFRDGIDRCPECSKKYDARMFEECQKAMEMTAAYLESVEIDHGE